MAKCDIVKFDENVLKDRIYSIRGYQVMLDSDLPELYNIEVRVLNQAVKRNQERFPDEFCFQLNISEVPELRSQIVISNKANNPLRSQELSSKKGGRRNLPYVFTQEVVATLSAVLRSETAVKMNIERFPENFCFLLNNNEMQNLKSQFATSSWDGRREKNNEQ